MEKIMAISTGVKKKSHEKLDNANVLQVKELLDAENPYLEERSLRHAEYQV